MRYASAPKFFPLLDIAYADGSFDWILAKPAKTDVIAIDDWGLAPLTDMQGVFSTRELLPECGHHAEAWIIWDGEEKSLFRKSRNDWHYSLSDMILPVFPVLYPPIRVISDLNSLEASTFRNALIAPLL